jgi:hypothetical protein
MLPPDLGRRLHEPPRTREKEIEMLTPKIIRALAGGASMAASLLGSAGCGGLGPGDYVTYRVAFESTKPSADCYADGEIPTDIKDDKNTFRDGSTIILYVAGDEEALLDTGDRVLAGSIDDDTYSFSGKETDINYPPGETYLDADHDGLDDEDNDPFVDADADGYDDYQEDFDGVDLDNDGLDDRFEDSFVDVNNDGEDDRIVELPGDTTITGIRSLAIEMTVDGSTVTGTSKQRQSQTCVGPLCALDYDASCTITTEFKGVEIEETDPGFGRESSSSP